MNLLLVLDQSSEGLEVGRDGLAGTHIVDRTTRSVKGVHLTAHPTRVGVSRGDRLTAQTLLGLDPQVDVNLELDLLTYRVPPTTTHWVPPHSLHPHPKKRPGAKGEEWDLST